MLTRCGWKPRDVHPQKALLIHFYQQDIFSVNVATTNNATLIFKENRNELRHKFKIHVHKRLYYLMTTL